MNEVQRVLIHMRWRLQSFVLLGFLFGLTVGHVEFSLLVVGGCVAWFFLCSGIAVYNSYYDKDKGAVAGLPRPPATTPAMLVGAWVLKLAGLVMTALLPPLFLIVYAVTVLLSVLYSHKKFRFKANGYVAVVFNFILGVMTFLVATSFVHPTAAIFFLGGITAGLFLASIYLMTQIHQREEDRSRGDISITVLYGERVTLGSAAILMSVAGILLFATFIVSGQPWYALAILGAYFLAVILFCYLWLQKSGRSLSNFTTMNNLVLRSSYAGNALFIIIYIFNTVRKP